MYSQNFPLLLTKRAPKLIGLTEFSELHVIWKLKDFRIKKMQKISTLNFYYY